MTISTAKFKTNNEAAHAVYDYISKSEKPGLSLRPFNRFSTDYSPWWLLPKSEKWPVYSCSKLFFEKIVIQNKHYLFAGFYVEKGLGNAVPKDGKKNLIMKPNWYWHEFLRKLKDGSYKDTITEALMVSKCPIVISIDAIEFNKVKQFDSEANYTPYDNVKFSIGRPSLKLKLIEPAKKILSDFNNCGSFQRLSDYFDDIHGQDFFWIDFHIGVILNYDSQAQTKWGASDIWHKVLEPWLQWIK